jgi:hypothetical protein
MTTYEQRLRDALIKQTAINNEITYLRLQIKQEAAQVRWAKTSPIIKGLKAQWPDAHIDSSPDRTYVSISLGVLDPNPDPLLLPFGWEKFEENQLSPGSLGSSVLSIYRLKGCPAYIYITKAVR